MSLELRLFDHRASSYKGPWSFPGVATGQSVLAWRLGYAEGFSLDLERISLESAKRRLRVPGGRESICPRRCNGLAEGQTTSKDRRGAWRCVDPNWGCRP